MAVDLRPSSVQLIQHSPSHQNLPATCEPIHVNARARMPYSPTSAGGPVGAPDPRVSVRARNYFTGTQRLAGLRPSSQRHSRPKCLKI